MSSINSTSPYRVQGAVISVAEMAKSRPGMVRQATEAQISEGKAWEEQTRLHQEAVKRYADAHPSPIIGQVLVGGKVFATVFSPGGVEMAHALPGLSDAQLSPEDRLAEIARAVQGDIRHSDFLPTLGGRYSSIPDEVAATFPKVTARPLGGPPEMTPALEQEMQQAFERARMRRAAEEPPKAE
jgi:hypothetical protein